MSDKWHGGKGSRYRKVDQQKYNENWERVFGKKDMKFSTAEEYVEATDVELNEEYDRFDELMCAKEVADDGESGKGMGDDGAD